MATMNVVMKLVRLSVDQTCACGICVRALLGAVFFFMVLVSSISHARQLFYTCAFFMIKAIV